MGKLMRIKSPINKPRTVTFIDKVIEYEKYLFEKDKTIRPRQYSHSFVKISPNSIILEVDKYSIIKEREGEIIEKIFKIDFSKVLYDGAVGWIETQYLEYIQ
jgi:hypothetical protein